MIETRDLTKKYGELFAIRSIELKLEEGDLFGFIGPNGAGKTTTMRILATLRNPTWGEAYVCGQSIYTHAKDIRRMVGFMPDFFGVYDDMKVVEYLEFFAAAYRIKGEARRKRCDEMLEIVDLDFKRDAFANTLSRGQTQRLGLARVLLHDPAILLLDEPLSGLDPRARVEMRNLLRRLGNMGKTIIVSSHILPELADICNKIGVIDRGVMSVNASVSDVMDHVHSRKILEITVRENAESAAALLEQCDDVATVDMKKEIIRVEMAEGIEDYSSLATHLIEAGYQLTLFREEEMSLESVFMALTKDMNPAVE